MDIEAILLRSPVDRVARRVTSQQFVEKEDSELTREEINAIVERLCRKQRLLKVVLKIKTKTQHKNFTRRVSRGGGDYRERLEPRAVAEYMRCGVEIYRLTNELGERTLSRKFAAKLNFEYRIKKANMESVWE
jgi:hypothetical protein